MYDQMKDYIGKIIQTRFNAWLKRRMPSTNRQTLSQRNIFILPSKFGFSYLLFVLLLFILGTNYQNNLIILLSYFFSSLFVTAMLYCFINLLGLNVAAKGEYQGFTDEQILIDIRIDTEQFKQSFQLSFEGHQSHEVIALKQEKLLKIAVKFDKRGIHSLGRLKLISEYPLGLFRCWTKLQFDLEVIVSPQPLFCQPVTSVGGDKQREPNHFENSSQPFSGEDFFELRAYRIGESLNQVAWKQMAKTGQWLSKRYQDNINEKQLISLKDMPAINNEVKLRHLSYLILQLHQTEQEYGVELDTLLIPASKGQQHLTHCLKALANYV